MATKKGQKAKKQTVKNVVQYTFFENVWDVVRLIPKGRVTSYGAIAKYLGSPKSSRAVGYAMKASGGQKPKVPAHRVLNRNGMLSGKHHFGASDIMQKLLENEGTEVKDDKVVHFEKLFWDPSMELAG
jgi:methylated-DNA-protein-cysteine methyltransferase-like protein